MGGREAQARASGHAAPVRFVDEDAADSKQHAFGAFVTQTRRPSGEQTRLACNTMCVVSVMESDCVYMIHLLDDSDYYQTTHVVGRVKRLGACKSAADTLRRWLQLRLHFDSTGIR